MATEPRVYHRERPLPPDPIWETIDPETGAVTGAWIEREGYTEERIRGYAAEYKPGHRLRVTRFTAETAWAEDD